MNNSRCYEELRAMYDKNDSRCYEELRAVNDMNNTICELRALATMNRLGV